MSRRRLNYALLQKVRDRIAAIPESYNQTTWYSPDDYAPCGTTACIAGEAIICEAPTVTEGIERLKAAVNSYSFRGEYATAYDWGRKALKLNDSEAAVLFNGYGTRWPGEFGHKFGRARSAKGRAKVAVAYLDWIIENGRVV